MNKKQKTEEPTPRAITGSGAYADPPVLRLSDVRQNVEKRAGSYRGPTCRGQSQEVTGLES